MNNLLDPRIFHVAGLNVKLEEVFAQVEDWWQMASEIPHVKREEIYQLGSEILLDLEQLYKPIVAEATHNHQLNIQNAYSAACILRYQAQFSYACCGYDIGDDDLKFRKAGSCCAMLRDAEGLCLGFAKWKKGVLPADQWLKLYLLAGEAMQQRAFINNDHIIQKPDRAVGVLAKAANVLGAAVDRHEQEGLVNCAPVDIGHLYELVSFVWFKRGTLIELQDMVAARFLYETAEIYTSQLVEGIMPGYQEIATERLVQIQTGLNRTSRSAPYSSRYVERIQP